MVFREKKLLVELEKQEGEVKNMLGEGKVLEAFGMALNNLSIAEKANAKDLSSKYGELLLGIGELTVRELESNKSVANAFLTAGIMYGVSKRYGDSGDSKKYIDKIIRDMSERMLEEAAENRVVVSFKGAREVRDKIKTNYGSEEESRAWDGILMEPSELMAEVALENLKHASIEGDASGKDAAVTSLAIAFRDVETLNSFVKKHDRYDVFHSLDAALDKAEELNAKDDINNLSLYIVNFADKGMDDVLKRTTMARGFVDVKRVYEIADKYLDHSSAAKWANSLFEMFKTQYPNAQDCTGLDCFLMAKGTYDAAVNYCTPDKVGEVGDAIVTAIDSAFAEATELKRESTVMLVAYYAFDIMRKKNKVEDARKWAVKIEELSENGIMESITAENKEVVENIIAMAKCFLEAHGGSDLMRK